MTPNQVCTWGGMCVFLIGALLREESDTAASGSSSAAGRAEGRSIYEHSKECFVLRAPSTGMSDVACTYPGAASVSAVLRAVYSEPLHTNVQRANAPAALAADARRFPAFTVVCI